MAAHMQPRIQDGAGYCFNNIDVYLDSKVYAYERLDWSPVFIKTGQASGTPFKGFHLIRHASRFAQAIPTEVKVESPGNKHGGRTAGIWRNSRASKRDVRSSGSWKAYMAYAAMSFHLFSNVN